MPALLLDSKFRGTGVLRAGGQCLQLPVPLAAAGCTVSAEQGQSYLVLCRPTPHHARDPTANADAAMQGCCCGGGAQAVHESLRLWPCPCPPGLTAAHAGVLLWMVVVAIYMAKRRTTRKRGPLMARVSSSAELRLGRGGSGELRKGHPLPGDSPPPLPHSPFQSASIRSGHTFRLPPGMANKPCLAEGAGSCLMGLTRGSEAAWWHPAPG